MFNYKNIPDEPPAPTLRVRIFDSLSSQWLNDFDALLDTGSYITCIPDTALKPGVRYNIEKNILPAGGINGSQKLDVVNFLDPTFYYLDWQSEVIHQQQYNQYVFFGIVGMSFGLIGRDILNVHLCNFDGPNLTFSL